MEGQNKRTEVVVECLGCGDAFPVPIEVYDSAGGARVTDWGCPECTEDDDE